MSEGGLVAEAGGPIWKPGMPTRCRSCLSNRLEYLEDGSGRCLACGVITLPAWASAPRRPSPTAPATAPETAPVAPSGWRRAHPTQGDATLPPPTLEEGLDDYRTARVSREKRLPLIVTVSALVALAFLLGGVSVILSNYPAPIIHMSNFYLTGDTLTCWVVQHVTLSNMGARAGVVAMTFYVDRVPYANFTFVVGPHATVAEYSSVHVPNCTARSYGIGLDSVEPA